MKSIETVYNGYRFRSRAEARWAILMDELGISYQYEPEGFEFNDGTKYLPDFYLPGQKAWLEIKGVMGEKDEHKIEQLCIATQEYVFVGLPDFTFYVYQPVVDHWFENGEWQYNNNVIKASKSEANICECKKCRNVYFKEIRGAWDCEICGYYDGDTGFDTLIIGEYGEEFNSKGEKALEKAKSARFEYGEHGTTSDVCTNPSITTVKKFMSSMVMKDTENRIERGLLYNAYMTFCIVKGYRAIKKRDFYTLLRRTFSEIKTCGAWYFIGLRFLQTPDELIGLRFLKIADENGL